MQLVIDIGNTRVKAALFEQKELKYFFIFNSMLEFISADLFEKYAIANCIIATVVDETGAFLSTLKEKTTVFLFTSHTPTPLKNLYKSIHTLGSDRLASAVGANFLFPNENLLVMDAGTCIKYNFVSSANEYIGGAISPGLQMRFKALNTFTARLPLLQPDENFDSLIGTDTSESILSGVEMGIIAEAEGFISKYQQLYPGLKILLTGGDVNFFEKRLKKPIFADSNLILKGLNVILDYNINAKK